MYQVSSSGVKDCGYTSEVRESHLSGDLRYRGIFMKFLS